MKSYKFSNSSLELPRGSSVTIPIYAIQHDPLYFPNPEEFEPERFSEDMQKLVKNTLLSFGEGPRTCIGERTNIQNIFSFTILDICDNISKTPYEALPNSRRDWKSSFIP